MSSEEFECLKHSRKYLRAKVTRRCNIIEQNIASFDCGALEAELLDLKELRVQLDDSNLCVSKSIWSFVTSSTARDKELDECDQYDCKFVSAIRSITSAPISASSPQGVGVASNGAIFNAKLKMPELPLPQYSYAKEENLEQFFRFESVINNYNLTSYEKFIFLQRQLRKEPLALIKSLVGDSQSYDTAKELLTKEFASPLTQRYDH